MLPEPDSQWVNSNTSQEIHRPSEEPRYRGVPYYSCGQRFRERHRSLSSVFTVGVWNQSDRLTPGRQIGAWWVHWIDEVLEFGHVELAQPDHSLTGTNLISVSLAGLDGPEGQFLFEVPEQCGIEHEHALCGLWPHIRRATPSHRTYLRPEHQIHRPDIGPLGLLAGRALDALRQQRHHLIGRQRIRIFMPLLDQMVCSEGACAGPALDHQVIELVDVTAGDQHLLGCDGRRIYLYDVAVTGPVVYPRIHDLAPYPRSNGSVIDQSRYPAVHLERG